MTESGAPVPQPAPDGTVSSRAPAHGRPLSTWLELLLAQIASRRALRATERSEAAPPAGAAAGG